MVHVPPEIASLLLYLEEVTPPPPALTHTRMTRSHIININPNALFFYGAVIRHLHSSHFVSTTLTTVSTSYSGISQSKNSNHPDRGSKWLEVACVSTPWMMKGLAVQRPLP